MISHLRRVFMIVLGLYWLALFLGTHVPVSLKTGPGGDKVLHFLAYTGLAFLMALVIGGHRPTWRAFALVLVATLAYGGFDEFSQLLVGRHCDVWDFVADFLGTLLGLFAYWVVVVINKSWLLARHPPKAEIATR
jgi:VanZ family protein